MTGLLRLSVLAGLGIVACSGGESEPHPLPSPGVSGSGGQLVGSAGSLSPTGGSSTAGSTGMGGGPSTAGTGQGGNPPTAGSAGAGGNGGAGGTGGAAGGSNTEEPVAHPLDITASAALHTHQVGGRQAGVDTRLPKIVGKLIVNVEVDNGGLYDYGIKHGFHVYGASMFHCDITESLNDYKTMTRDFNGNCRLETWDGENHNGGSGTTPATSIQGKVKAALAELAENFPEEGWAYFLSADGNVRWTDVGITGYSHGATSAVRWAKKTKLWRIVSRSGPRDNLCGNGANMPFKTDCSTDVISAWLDEESLTPVDRLYGFVGNKDGQYGDILFAMDRMKYVGAATDVTTAAPTNGSHRFFINGDHSDFNGKQFWPTMDIAWSTPPENVAYANSH
jgi:hypothetical protein